MNIVKCPCAHCLLFKFFCPLKTDAELFCVALPDCLHSIIPFQLPMDGAKNLLPMEQAKVKKASLLNLYTCDLRATLYKCMPIFLTYLFL
jgi:hypothetical protein